MQRPQGTSLTAAQGSIAVVSRSLPYLPPRMFVASLLFGCVIGIGIQERVALTHADKAHNRTRLPGLRVVGALRRNNGAHGLHLASIHCSDWIGALIAVSGFEGRTNWTMSASDKQQSRRDWDQPLHLSRAGCILVEKGPLTIHQRDESIVNLRVSVQFRGNVLIDRTTASSKGKHPPSRTYPSVPSVCRSPSLLFNSDERHVTESSAMAKEIVSPNETTGDEER